MTNMDDDNAQFWAHHEQQLQQQHEEINMGLIAKETGGSFELAPQGTHSAVCVRVIDLGMQINKTTSKPERKVVIVWEIDAEMVDNRPFIVQKRYTLSLHKKANLRADLQSWRGRPFTDEELAGFDLKNVLGKPCLLNVIHSDSGEYANIASISQLPKGMPGLKPTGELLFFNTEEWDATVFNKLSEKMRTTILSASEPPAAAAVAKIEQDDMDQDIPF